MKRYTIYCTPEQTNKAKELGAPIEVLYTKDDYQQRNPTISIKGEFIKFDYFVPTAEQIIGWLEEHDEIIAIETTQLQGFWTGFVETTNYKDAISKIGYTSRKEATLAAIDAALECLSKKQTEE